MIDKLLGDNYGMKLSSIQSKYMILCISTILIIISFIVLVRFIRQILDVSKTRIKIKKIEYLFNSIMEEVESTSSYMRYSTVIHLKCSLTESLKTVQKIKNMFLKKRITQLRNNIENYIEIIEEKRDVSNEEFYERECQMARDIFFDENGEKLLTDEQLKAVLCDDDRNLIIAGAGAGKTRVIDFKVRYLVNYKAVDPSKIVLLSFSRKSARDLVSKISENVPGIKAQTIHSFCAQVIKMSYISLFDEKKKEYESFIINALVMTLKNKEISRMFDEFYQRYFSNIRPFIFYNSLDDLRTDLKKSNSKLISVGDRFEEFKAKRSLKTLKGDYVRSVDERYIADFLYLHHIDYEYEMKYPHSDEYYYPDFYLVDYDMYLEHFAIASNGLPPPYFINPQGYLDGIEWKRQIHQSNNTVMIETFSYLLNDGRSSDYLLKVFKESGLEIKSDGEDEESLKKISREFSRIFARFYNSFKLSGFSIEDLQQYSTVPGFSIFLSVFKTFLLNYQKLVKNEGRMDFTDMIIDTIEMYKNGGGKEYEYVIVDEFQDTSSLAMVLFDQIINRGDNTAFVGVGDDWQSIYGFNGSDPTILSDYESNYPGAAIKMLNSNFRSHSRIVDLGIRFVSKNPLQIKKNVESKNTKLLTSDIGFLTFEQMEQKIGNIPDNESIFVLYRYNDDSPARRGIFKNYFYLDRNGNHLKNKYCNKNISLLTIHGSKGMEARHVFILFPDGINRKFPSEIEDHFIFDMLKSHHTDFPFAEERRLMYVAITRAEQNLYFVSPRGKDPNSIFWDELITLC